MSDPTITDKAVTAAVKACQHARADGADDAQCWRLGLAAALPHLADQPATTGEAFVVDFEPGIYGPFPTVEAAHDWAGAHARTELGEMVTWSVRPMWPTGARQSADRDTETAALRATLDQTTERLGDIISDAGLPRPETLADALDATAKLADQHTNMAEQLADIGAVISVCALPESGPCAHGAAWPCEMTEVYWIAIGLDPAKEEARLRAASLRGGE